MNESEFNQLGDELMLVVEEALDNCEVDIDYETSAGVMSLTIESDGSKVIISRQPAMSQIWLAAKSGGYHFSYQAEDWVCTTTKETFKDLLNRVCTEQAGERVELDFTYE